MACPYCKKLYHILTVFVAPQCGVTLFFAGGTKHEITCEHVSKANFKANLKKTQKLFLK